MKARQKAEKEKELLDAAEKKKKLVEAVMNSGKSVDEIMAFLNENPNPPAMLGRIE